MCGIAGIVSWDGPVGRDDVGGSLAAQRHRGPDAEGAWSDGVCALGHRRLAVIDLSEAGRQPLANEDGAVRVTFNGEVYNFRELRRELEGLGHRFRTGTDTEVIVHGYEQWGTDCVRRFRGMFAFGVWDARRRRLFLARDRVGKKPLFYTRDGGRLLFASEIQGILADPGVPRGVDLAALDDYLAWGYVPAPATGFLGVAKLPPAHWLTLDLGPDGPATRVERYWSLPYGPKLRLGRDEAAEALRATLTEAVRLRMVSDVPLGAFLSGGIDSSVVVGLMAGLSSRPVRTFSIGFDEAGFDELPHARRVAERWGTEHHEFVVRPDALADLPTLVRHFGEPFADSSAVPTYHVSRLTRGGVTVALNGDGGDEGFLGYERYWANRAARRIGRVPGGRLATSAVARRLGAPGGGGRLGRARRFLAAAARPEAERYAHWVGYFDAGARARLYRDDMAALSARRDAEAWMGSLFRGAGGLDGAEAAGAVDVLSYLPYDLLVKVDVTSMAVGLEARSPLLDHEVLEFAARLPASLKLRGMRSKYLLRYAFTDLLPPENVNRRKMGFGVPVGRWFRGPLRDLLCDGLLSGRSLGRGYFQPAEVRRLVDDHLSGRCDHGQRLWNLLMLELWHGELVDRRGAPTPVPAAGTAPGDAR